MSHQPEVIEARHLLNAAIRKSLFVTFFWAICSLLESHHVFAHIGKMGEFVIASVADHAFFDWIR